MKEIFLVTKTEFDTLENSIGNAITQDTFPYYFTSQEEAQEYVRKEEKRIKKYQGWDGKMYPYFLIKKYDPLEANNEENEEKAILSLETVLRHYYATLKEGAKLVTYLQDNKIRVEQYLKHGKVDISFDFKTLEKEQSEGF